MPRPTPDTPAQFRQPRAGSEIFEPAAEGSEPSPAELPTIEIQTTIEHRGRTFTVVARGYTLDKLCDILDRAGYQPPTPAEWRKLPDGTPICPKHATPMRLREKQGDSWWSHRVKGPDGNEYWCKGYHGKDSPGYDL